MARAGPHRPLPAASAAGAVLVAVAAVATTRVSAHYYAADAAISATGVPTGVSSVTATSVGVYYQGSPSATSTASRAAAVTYKVAPSVAPTASPTAAAVPFYHEPATAAATASPTVAHVVATGETRAGAAGSTPTPSGCVRKWRKCGIDTNSCTTTQRCTRHGCSKQTPYTCSYTVAKRYDCNVETQAPCKKPLWRSYSCDKWSWGWVANGCERVVKKAYGCVKEVAGKCTKERDVTEGCEVTKQVACKKVVSSPCDKTYRKVVTCANAHSYGYDGKPCHELISYRGVCTKEHDAQCEVKSKGLCKKTQTYDVPCTKKKWHANGCTYEATEKYGCMKNTKSTGKCWYKVPAAEATCLVKKWVVNGCRKMVHHTGQCKAWTWEPDCCAHSETVYTCKDKWCPVTECEATAAAAATPTPAAPAKVTVAPTPTAAPYKAWAAPTATVTPKRSTAPKWTAPYKVWPAPSATVAIKSTAAPYKARTAPTATQASTSGYYR